MQVETFEIEETVVGGGITTPAEVEVEAVGMIESLGLEGQKKLLTPKEEDDSVVERVPYPIMSKAEQRVYEACFPVHGEVVQYSAGIIPVRVLQVIEHAKPMFERIEVWHDKVMNPNPILVGRVEWNTYRMLARWGEALVPFEDLMLKAQDILEKQWKIKLGKTLRAAQSQIDNLPEEVYSFLTGEYVLEP